MDSILELAGVKGDFSDNIFNPKAEKQCLHLCNGWLAPWMAPKPGVCLLWACQQAGPEIGALQERPHQSLVQKVKPVPASNPSIFFFIQTQVSKMARGKFPFCLRGSLAPGMNKLLLCRKNKPTNNNFSYYICIFRIRTIFMGTWHWVFLGSRFYKPSPRLLKLQSFLSRVTKWLTLSCTLPSFLSQGKGLNYTLLAFQDNILPWKFPKIHEIFFIMPFTNQSSYQVRAYNIYMWKKKVLNFGKVKICFIII